MADVEAHNRAILAVIGKRMSREEKAVVISYARSSAAASAVLRELATAEKALYRSQRRVDALRVFDRLRRGLVQEHGMDPCAELQRLQQQILRGDPALELSGETP